MSFSVLMVDDDNDDKMLFKYAFEQSNFAADLKFVADGVELFEYLEKCIAQENKEILPSIILLDLNMPRMDGKEALRLLKNNPEMRKIPVIIFSTSNSDKDIAGSYELGANSYVIKPSSLSKLIHFATCIKTYWMETVILPQT
jgi:two-component system response regulator